MVVRPKLIDVVKLPAVHRKRVQANFANRSATTDVPETTLGAHLVDEQTSLISNRTAVESDQRLVGDTIDYLDLRKEGYSNDEIAEKLELPLEHVNALAQYLDRRDIDVLE
jgi:hypothetical protein